MLIKYFQITKTKKNQAKLKKPIYSNISKTAIRNLNLLACFGKPLLALQKTYLNKFKFYNG